MELFLRRDGEPKTHLFGTVRREKGRLHSSIGRGILRSSEAVCHNALSFYLQPKWVKIRAWNVQGGKAWLCPH